MGNDKKTGFDPVSPSRISDLLRSYKIGETPTPPKAPATTQAPRGPSEMDHVRVQGEPSFRKFSDEALKKTVVRGVFAASTGIGLNPRVATALNGTMVAAAKIFLDNPSLARTENGAEIMMQLMTNVDGFMDLGKGKQIG